LTKSQNALIIGAKRAGYIKYKSLKNAQFNITIVSKSFANDFECKMIKDEFLNLDFDYFFQFNLIYIAFKPNEQEIKLIKKLQENNLFVNVLSNPTLSNFIHPCSKKNSNFIVSVAQLKKPNPKLSCALAKKFANEE
jgi:siroheme synthase (precorrin-2 oxidase/ferrochelatase)